VTDDRPQSWVVRGNATAEEIAAVVAVLTACAAAAAVPPVTPTASAWAGLVRRLAAPDSGAWRRSAIGPAPRPEHG
jgi:hypothetical protein